MDDRELESPRCRVCDGLMDRIDVGKWDIPEHVITIAQEMEISLDVVLRYECTHYPDHGGGWYFYSPGEGSLFLE